MLNIDWFNPYEETPYSAGVIYFVVQNLPRSERFKFENVILVGMIPGPNEPKKHINTYLAHIVKTYNISMLVLQFQILTLIVERLSFVLFFHVYPAIYLQHERCVASIVSAPYEGVLSA